MSNTELKTLVMWDRPYLTRLTKKFENRKVWKEADPYMVISFIPGTVRDILVKNGQSVKLGDPIMLLESMKMKNIIRSAVNGKIKAIHVKSDEKIPKNHLMIEME